MVPARVLRDDPLRIEKGAQGVSEVKAATLEAGIALGVVPLELNAGDIGQWPMAVKMRGYPERNRSREMDVSLEGGDG